MLSRLPKRLAVNDVVDAAAKTFEVRNPATGRLIADVPDMGAEDTRRAIKEASQAFSTWRRSPAKYRSDLLRTWFDVCKRESGELAQIVQQEQGKPMKEAQTEVQLGSSYIEWFSEECRRINGDTLQASSWNKQIMVIKEPIGVAAMITPWNFPFAMITRKVGAALAAGCTCVIKPAEDTPLAAIALAHLAELAKIPKGVINVVTGSYENSPAIGKALCDSPDVKVLSFTGSTEVGQLLYKQCARSTKKLSLELGGNAPFIVFESADLDLAVECCVASKFRNAGQACSSPNRILVQAGVHDQFVQMIKKHVETSIVVGSGDSLDTTQGPLINEHQFNRIQRLVNDAIKEGAMVVTGGGPHERGGLFFQPTILTNVDMSVDCFKREIFGPVLSIVAFETEAEAVAIANDTNMGLASYIFSTNVNQCWRVVREIEAGVVNVNDGTLTNCEGPIGGIKDSGLGREGSKYGIDEYVELKTVAFGNTDYN